MANYNKQLSETSARFGEVRFSYCNVFSPRRNDDGSEGKYGCAILIPKSDTEAIRLYNACVEKAKQLGVSSKWNGKTPSASKLHLPLRDGDEEHPEDEAYRGMYFFNATSKSKPGIRVLENGSVVEALDAEDFYSGCYGAVTVNFFAYSSSGNVGVAAGLNNVIKTRDGERLSGGSSAEADFGDLASDVDPLG